MKRNKIMFFTIAFINIIGFALLVILPFFTIKYAKIIKPVQLIVGMLLFFTPSYIAMIMYLIAKKRQANIKIVMFILNFFSFSICIIISAILNLNNVLISETTNINNYLIFDDYLKGYESDPVFPKVIPPSARDIRYFYRYRHSLDADYDIYLEITLSKEEYQQEKVRIENCENVTIVNSLYYDNRIDYIIGDNYIDIDNLDRSYFVKFVSFCDEKFNIRYIVSSAMDPSDKIKPFFL